MSALLEEVDAIDREDALFGGRESAEHFVAIGDAGLLLNDGVSDAGWDIVSVGPDSWARIVREERTFELVAGSRGREDRAPGLSRSTWSRAPADHLAAA